MALNEKSSATRRKVLRTTAGGVVAGLLAIPGSAAADHSNGKDGNDDNGGGGGGGGGGGQSDPVIDDLDVEDTSDSTVEAEYDVEDADGDLDKVALAVIDGNEVVGYDYEDISGGEVEGALETAPLAPGKYKWAFIVADEKKNVTSDKGKVTVE